MRRDNRRERGVVMFLTVLLLALMGGLGLAALDAASRDRDSAGYYNREAASFYAAEAAIAHARAIIKNDVSSTGDTPAFPTEAAPQSLYVSGGGTVTPSSSLPPATYFGDPTIADPPIRCIDDESAGQYGEGMNLQSKGAKALATLWTINVAGRGPDGQLSRIEAKEVKFFFVGY
jgi:Tfp pilus assembly protein PilX